MKTYSIAQIVAALAAISEAKTDKRQIDGGETQGILILATTNDEVPELEMTVAEFDDIYRGMVKCWPVIKPLKESVIVANRELRAKTKAETTAKQKEAELADKAKAKAEREAAIQQKKDDAAAEKKRKQEELEAKRKEREALAIRAKEALDAKKVADEKAKVEADTKRAKEAAKANEKKTAKK